MANWCRFDLVCAYQSKIRATAPIQFIRTKKSTTTYRKSEQKKYYELIQRQNNREKEIKKYRAHICSTQAGRQAGKMFCV